MSCFKRFICILFIVSFCFISIQCNSDDDNDEETTYEWYKDSDGDGYSDGISQTATKQPGDSYFKASELVSVSGDLNDNDPDVSPGISEICNDTKDNDCDFLTDCNDSDCASVESCKSIRKIGLMTDMGGLGDESYIDSAYDGLLRAQQNFDFRIVFKESAIGDDYVKNLSELAQDGVELIYCIGSTLSDAINPVAQQYEDTYFGAIDIPLALNQASLKSAGLLFKEQESGYLAGIVAGLLTYSYHHISDKLNDSNVLGVIIGMDILPCEKYQAGFYKGVMEVNPGCQVLSVNTNDFKNPSKGEEASLELINKGADIVFNVAGETGIGIISRAKKENILAIGVDKDQNHLAPDTVVFSAIKDISEVVLLSIQDYFNGDWGEHWGGDNLIFGILENATGISSFHNFDSIIPDEVKQKLTNEEQRVREGKIKIPVSKLEAGYPEENTILIMN